ASGVEAERLTMIVSALNGDVAVLDLDDRLRRLAIVRVIDGAEADVGGAVESDDVAVGQTDFRSPAPAGNHFIARIDRQVDARIDLAAIFGLTDDRAAIVKSEIRLIAALGRLGVGGGG